MRYFSLTTVVCALLFPLCFLPADENGEDDYPEGALSEDKHIALLLEASEHTSAQLKAIQDNLAAFRRQEAHCIDSPNNTEALYKFSECALKLLNSIREVHVEPYFRTAFLEELEKISKTAKNRSIPPICTP